MKDASVYLNKDDELWKASRKRCFNTECGASLRDIWRIA